MKCDNDKCPREATAHVASSFPNMEDMVWSVCAGCLEELMTFLREDGETPRTLSEEEFTVRSVMTR